MCRARTSGCSVPTQLLHHRQDRQDQLVSLWRAQSQSPVQIWREALKKNKHPGMLTEQLGVFSNPNYTKDG